MENFHYHVGSLMVKAFALAFLAISVCHQHVDLNVFRPANVVKIKPVLMASALILARVYAVEQQSAELCLIIQFVLVLLDILGVKTTY